MILSRLRTTIFRRLTTKTVTRTSLASPALRRRFGTENAAPEEEVIPETKEQKISETVNHSFKTETKKLLDIVAKSLYTDAEVFLRELLSNCSDALEKQRLMEIRGDSTGEGDPHQITILTNESKRQIVIQDTGIGMSKQEMIDNLGTIAGSGSKKFLDEYNSHPGQEKVDTIIGQFGVGFYSSFIVGHTIEVISKREGEKDAHLWVSDGSGEFSISTIDGVSFDRGTQIKIYLHPEHSKFASKVEIENIIEKFSNFIKHPIFLNGERMNKNTAIWAQDRSSLKESDYKQLWEHVSGTRMPYKFMVHFNSDMPLQIRSILYSPSVHNEKMSMTMERLQVDLYSRKILIKKNCQELLPEYFRFIKGIVDCEDLPLNISRENYQDTQLIGRLRSTLTKRVIRMIQDFAKNEPKSYNTWYKDFQHFLKQGVIMDPENAQTLLALLRYGTDRNAEWSLDEYVENMRPNQQNIYYLLATTSSQGESSPYYEPFKGGDVPVLFVQDQADEIVFQNIGHYKNKKFVNIESDYDSISQDVTQHTHDTEKGLPETEVTSFCLWVKNELQPVVSQVKLSQRLKNNSSVIISPLSSAMRQMTFMMDPSQRDQLSKNLTFEINPNHSLMVRLNEARKIDPQLAATLLKQNLDGCLLDAGLLMDPKDFIARINNLLLETLENRLSGKSFSNIHTEPAVAHVQSDETPVSSATKPESILEQAMKDMAQQEKKRVSKGVKSTIEIGEDGKPILK